MASEPITVVHRVHDEGTVTQETLTAAHLPSSPLGEAQRLLALGRQRMEQALQLTDAGQYAQASALVGRGSDDVGQAVHAMRQLMRS